MLSFTDGRRRGIVFIMKNMARSECVRRTNNFWYPVNDAVLTTKSPNTATHIPQPSKDASVSSFGNSHLFSRQRRSVLATVLAGNRCHFPRLCSRGAVAKGSHRFKHALVLQPSHPNLCTSPLTNIRSAYLLHNVLIKSYLITALCPLFARQTPT